MDLNLNDIPRFPSESESETMSAFVPILPKVKMLPPDLHNNGLVDTYTNTTDIVEYPHVSVFHSALENTVWAMVHGRDDLLDEFRVNFDRPRDPRFLLVLDECLDNAHLVRCFSRLRLSSSHGLAVSSSGADSYTAKDEFQEKVLANPSIRNASVFVFHPKYLHWKDAHVFSSRVLCLLSLSRAGLMPNLKAMVLVQQTRGMGSSHEPGLPYWTRQWNYMSRTPILHLEVVPVNKSTKKLFRELFGYLASNYKSQQYLLNIDPRYKSYMESVFRAYAAGRLGYFT